MLWHKPKADQLLQDTRDDPGMPVVLLDIDRCAFMGEDSNDLLRTSTGNIIVLKDKHNFAQKGFFKIYSKQLNTCFEETKHKLKLDYA